MSIFESQCSKSNSIYLLTLLSNCLCSTAVRSLVESIAASLTAGNLSNSGSTASTSGHSMSSGCARSWLSSRRSRSSLTRPSTKTSPTETTRGRRPWTRWSTPPRKPTSTTSSPLCLSYVVGLWNVPFSHDMARYLLFQSPLSNCSHAVHNGMLTWSALVNGCNVWTNNLQRGLQRGEFMLS